MVTEPLILVMGNCQAHALAAVLAASGAGTVCILHKVHGFRPSCWGVQPLILPLEEAQSTADRFVRYGRPVILVEQTSPLVKPVPDDFLPGVPRIRFPHVQLHAWWHKPDAVISADRLRRLWKFDLVAIRQSEAAAGLDDALSTYIAETAPQRPIFWMPVHPDAEVMRWIYGIICTRLAEFGDYGAASAQPAMPDMLDFYSEHPLRREVVDALGLDWAGAPLYQAWTEAVGAHHRGDLATSAALHERLLEQPGVDRHVWGSYAGTLLAAGRREEAHRAFGAAHRAFPHNQFYAWSWTSTLSPTAQTDDTEPFVAMVSDLYEPFRST